MICKTCKQDRPIEKFGLNPNGKPRGKECQRCRGRAATEKMRAGLRKRPVRPDGYFSWEAMCSRCYNQNGPEFPNYGGRGIKVCDEWRGPGGFTRFIAHMGPRPTRKHTIDRYPDKDGDYEPGNCRWATMKQQQNNRRNNRLLTHNGRTQTMSQWAEELGISVQTLHQRIKRGCIPADEVLSYQPPLIEYNGQKLSATEWSPLVGIKANTISKRIQDGWTPEKALTTPVRNWGR